MENQQNTNLISTKDGRTIEVKLCTTIFNDPILCIKEVKLSKLCQVPLVACTTKLFGHI